MRVLVINTGSSSVKVSLVGGSDDLLVEQEFGLRDGNLDERDLAAAVHSIDSVEAVGHRVVHGGDRYRESTRVTPDLVGYLAAITDLAPLHLPHSVEAMTAVHMLLPRVPAVACFDTAFHAHLPEAASTFALPAEWRVRYGLRRYGFHGLSHAYASRRAAEILRRPLAELRVVTCHLGAGASLAAVAGGTSVDTTMGFTPLDGLVMATRAGSLDPGLLLWLQRRAGIGVEEMSLALEERSGLLALSGTADMREVIAAANAGDPAARLAIEVYLHRLRAGIASMAAAMQGLDVLVFTGGVGENSPAVRSAAAAGLHFLGVEIGPTLNASLGIDTDLSTPDARVRTVVVKAREDIEVAREVRRLLGAPA